MDVSEEELSAIAQDVATGVVTPAPGCQPMTRGITLTMSGPSTAAAPRTPTSVPVKRQLTEEEKSDGERESKRQDATELPRKHAEKRPGQTAQMNEDKKGRVEEAQRAGGEETRAEPHSTGHLYPPHYPLEWMQLELKAMEMKMWIWSNGLDMEVKKVTTLLKWPLRSYRDARQRGVRHRGPENVGNACNDRD